MDGMSGEQIGHWKRNSATERGTKVLLSIAIVLVSCAVMVALLIAIKGISVSAEKQSTVVDCLDMAIKRQSSAIEKLQEQVAKLAANQLATQSAVDNLNTLPDWQKQVEDQIDILKSELEAKQKTTPALRVSRWSAFKAQVENNA